MEGQDERDILLEACRITEGSRKEMYGAPEDNLARIADLWSVSRDSWVDIAGYARVGWMCDGKP